MSFSPTYKGYNYVSYYNGAYSDADSMAAMAASGANSAALVLDYGLNVTTSRVYADTRPGGFTDPLTALSSAIREAAQLGLSVMVRPLVDFLPGAYGAAPTNLGTYQPLDWRAYFNPGNTAAFFASYKTMIVNQAKAAQAGGAALLCIGTEIDQLTGPQYLAYWTDIIASIRAAYTGKLTYSAIWDDAISPWAGAHGLPAGTGNLATQVSFWSQLDYVGLDVYAAISDKANPTMADLVAGWNQTPTDPVTKSVTGNQSLIQYFETVAKQIGKPLMFTELGYQSASDAARNADYTQTGVFDPVMQANLYQAFFTAWQQSGDSSLAGVYFWNWDPNTAEVGPGNGVNWSPQGLPAQAVATQGFAAAGVADRLFDEAYYLAHNADVVASGVDPYQHYMTLGWKQGRDPSALFHTTYYLNQNPDVAAAGVNPLLHFESYGWREGRDPSVVFSLAKYLVANPDVAAAGVDLLLHYVVSGQAEGRAIAAATPHGVGAQDPGVDAAYYYGLHPDVAAAGLDAGASYHGTGWRSGYNPSAVFDTNFYLGQNPDVKAAGIDPLLHFESFGWREGRDPSLAFSDSQYLAAYPAVKASGADPLLDYLNGGKAAGRLAFLSGGQSTADPMISAAYYDAQLGATLIPAGAAAEAQAAFGYHNGGWARGLNPDAWFDTAYYLGHNPDVAAAHVDPLLHYESYGWREGRDPSAQFSTAKYLAAYADVKAAGLNPLLHFVAYGQAEGRSAFYT